MDFKRANNFVLVDQRPETCSVSSLLLSWLVFIQVSVSNDGVGFF